MAKPAPTKKPRPKAFERPVVDPMAKALVTAVQTSHGMDHAASMAMAEEIGKPRGFVGTRNIAIDRAIASPGIPLGRITEISGWEGSGKSTCLDQIIAECQARGGVAMLADTERARDRPYMVRLGVQPDSMVWCLGRTVEQMFDEVQTFSLNIASMNAVAWVEALARAGVRVPTCSTYRHATYDPLEDPKKKNRKPMAVAVLARWGREQAAALLHWQRENGLTPSGVRDSFSRQILRPAVLFGSSDEQKEALEYWDRGDYHPCVVPADRPVVVGWDSVGGTATEAELEGDARALHVAASAKVIKRNFRRLVQYLDDEAIAFVICNQRYEKIDTTYIPGAPKRKQSETYGGSAIKYHSGVRLELEKTGRFWITNSAKEAGEPPIGQVTRVKVVKNKVGVPDRVEEYGLVYGRGADNAWAIYTDLKAQGVISPAGGWSKFTNPSILGDQPGGDKNWRAGWMGLSDMMADRESYPTLWEKLSALYLER